MTTKRRVARVVSGLALVLAAGCATAAPPPPSTAPPTTGPPSGTPPVTPGSVLVDGAVRQATTLDPAALARMPQTDVTVTFGSERGPQTRAERGVLLASLLPAGALATVSGPKNDTLSFAVLAVGADGYRALVSYGEVSPDFGNRGLLVSTVEDGRPLPRPRLVVPGDVKGGRYVSDLVELRVIRPG